MINILQLHLQWSWSLKRSFSVMVILIFNHKDHWSYPPMLLSIIRPNIFQSWHKTAYALFSEFIIVRIKSQLGCKQRYTAYDMRNVYVNSIARHINSMSEHSLSPRILIRVLTNLNSWSFKLSITLADDARPVLIKFRVGTERFQGKQIHSGILWTLGIPKMWLLLKSNVVMLKVQGCQVATV